MNNELNGSADWAAEVTRLSGELAVANEDVALLQRLKDAAPNVERLTAELETAQAQLVMAREADVAAAQEARIGGIVDVVVSDDVDETLLGANFYARVTRLTYSDQAKQSLPVQHPAVQFRDLPSDVLEYLIVRQPEAIPTRIRALGADPEEAIGRYHVALRRGFVSTRGEL